MKILSYADCCIDPNLFGDWFSGESWDTWRVFDKAIFGEALDDAELATFRELTGRDEAPTEPADEVWCIFGRRGGKDVKAASLAVYLATIGVERYGWAGRLVRGERGVVQVLAVDRDQAKIAMGYARAFLEKPMLRKLVKSVTTDVIELKNGFGIEITTNDQRRVRGRTVVATIFDEVAHWKSENSISPDEDVYKAVKPAMVTMPGALLIGISSPYARKGLLWRKYRSHYGKPGTVLVAKAPTWVMNPTVPRDGKTVLEAYESDPAWASAEYGAEFRTDVEQLLTLEAVQACVDDGCYELPPLEDTSYIAFVDPSGGSADSMTLAIAHKSRDNRAILDLLREVKPPFDPESVVADFSDTLKRYSLKHAYGDKYGGEWVKSAFWKAGITYLSDIVPPKSQLYLDLVPLINAGQCSLLDIDRLVQQIVALERRTGRGTGRDVIDHPPGGHDDVANVVAGVFRALGFHNRPAPEPKKQDPEWLVNGRVDLTKIPIGEYLKLIRRAKEQRERI